MCKFKSLQKDKSRPVGRFLENFCSKSKAFNCWYYVDHSLEYCTHSAKLAL